MDKSGEQTSSSVKHFSQQVGLTLRIFEESTQWANRAELYIRILKEAIRKDFRTSNSPLVLWDYCAEHRALIHNLVPRDLFKTSGKSPMQATFGTQGDISNLCVFDWYDWCYYCEESNNQFPHQKYLLGRVLGPSKNEGNKMAQNILNHNGKIVPRRTLRQLTIDKLNSVGTGISYLVMLGNGRALNQRFLKTIRVLTRFVVRQRVNLAEYSNSK